MCMLEVVDLKKDYGTEPNITGPQRPQLQGCEGRVCGNYGCLRFWENHAAKLHLHH